MKSGPVQNLKIRTSGETNPSLISIERLLVVADLSTGDGGAHLRAVLFKKKYFFYQYYSFLY